jgi:peptide chain release factor 3
MNKLDRDGRETLDLIVELEEPLGIEGYAMNWPIGSGKVLEGLYDRKNHRIERYRPATEDQRFAELDADSKLPATDSIAKESTYRAALDDVELLEDAGNQFDLGKVMRGDQTPVFFGSALTNFGVETFLDSFVDMAPEPSTKKTDDETAVSPTENSFTGFIFKIQANMNSAHRDCIAFVRIVSGEFERGWM